MSITYDSLKKQFHLHTKNTSYLMEVIEGKHLLHAYWGKRIHIAGTEPLVDLFEAPSFSPNPERNNKKISFDTLPREYPDYGRSDYESPAIEIKTSEGSHIIEPDYMFHQITDGKIKPQGLPATWFEPDDEIQTLLIRLHDSLHHINIDLYYCVCESYDVITRHVVISNDGADPIKLRKVLSSCVDFYQDDNFELINLYGAWARERHVSRIPIGKSAHVIDSKRGASSHEQNPFIALVRPETDDHSGEVYSMNLVYSGSFMAEVSVNSYGKTRMQMGLNPIDFEWILEPEKIFSSPEAVLVYSDSGLNGMSAIYHRL